MSDERGETVDLTYIGWALHRLTSKIASLRDDMNVLTAMVLRVDNTATRMLDELRYAHAACPSDRPRARLGGQ
jgi:hypothetical protein